MKQIAVITGGAGEIGLATAKLLGKDHHLVICDISQKRLDAASKELNALGLSFDSTLCDITESDSVDELVNMATDLGHIACVVNAAGVSPRMAEPETILRVNALGAVNINEAFFQVIRKNFVMVNVASMAAHLIPAWATPEGAYPYALTAPDEFIKKVLRRCRLVPKSTSRRGLAFAISYNFVVWYSKMNAAKFGQRDARVLSVSPGIVDNKMGHLEEKTGAADLQRNTPLRRACTVDEIAELLAFMASDKAGFITGTDILCDGGFVSARSE